MSVVRFLLAIALVCVGSLVAGQTRFSALATPAPAQPASITVVLDDNYPPYIFRNSQGQIDGILKDTWALWQAHTGVAVKLQPMDWAVAQQTMLTRHADVIDTLFKTPERERLYDFSQPYVTLNVPIFFHNSVSGIVNADSIKGFTVGVKDGDACIETLQKHGVDSFKRYPSYSAVVAAAGKGDLRVFCVDEPPGVYLLQQFGLSNSFKHSEPLSTGQFHRAVRRGNAAMLALVERGFASITPAEYRQIEEKWYGSNVETIGNPDMLRHVRYGATAVLALALALLLWNLTLRKRVREKTQVLSDAMDELAHTKQAAELALNQLQSLANRAPGMVYQYLLRPDGSACIPFASEMIRDFYRVSPEQVRHDATAVFAAIHPDDQGAVKASIQASAAALTPWQHEFRTQFDDGTVRWLFGNASPERLADGAVLWHGFTTDITERKALDEKLRQLSRAAEQAPLAIVITNLQGTIEYANPSFTQISGYSAQEAIGANPRLLQSGLTPKEVFVDLWQTLSAGQVWQGELHNRKKNGELFIEHAVIAPVLDAQGQATHYVAMKQDITQRKRADLALQTSLQEKVALLHEVHHRVKNNLQVITSLLRLEAGRSDQPTTRAVLKDMQGRIYAMALLHETLYRASNFAWIDLAAYLKQLATQAFRSQAGQSGEVSLVLELAPVNVAMDQATPCGLLVNELLSNALKHGFADGRNGQITLRSQPADTPSFWRVSVQDTGVGLPADFDTRRTQSLGLQLVSDLTRQLNGTLETHSVEGAGTTFSVVFAVETPPVLVPDSGVSAA